MNQYADRLVDGLVNHEAIAFNMLEYVKENFQVDGEYLTEEHVIKLQVNNNPVNVARAKEFIEEKFGADLIQVIC